MISIHYLFLRLFLCALVNVMCYKAVSLLIPFEIVVSISYFSCKVEYTS